jgi:hypothetical protein
MSTKDAMQTIVDESMISSHQIVIKIRLILITPFVVCIALAVALWVPEVKPHCTLCKACPYTIQSAKTIHNIQWTRRSMILMFGRDQDGTTTGRDQRSHFRSAAKISK